MGTVSNTILSMIAIPEQLYKRYDGDMTVLFFSKAVGQ